MAYRYGLKLWSVNTDAYYVEAKNLFDQGVFDYIELYVLPDSLDRLPEWKKLKIPYIIHCAHSAHGFNLANKDWKTSNLRIYGQVKQYADELNASRIIFHGGCDGAIEETICQLKSFNEPRALIENKPLKPLPDPFHTIECRGATLNELKLVKDNCHCGFCLDIGHAFCAANSQHEQPYYYIHDFIVQLQPEMYHLSDVASEKSVLDSHLHFGKGCLDIPEVMKLIPNTTDISIETVKEHQDSLDDFLDDIRYIRRIIKK